jgi:acetyl esterase/lipase
MRRPHTLGLAAALLGLAAALVGLASCRKTPPRPSPFSRASVVAQLGPSHPGVTLPSDELPRGVRADEELVYDASSGEALALDVYRPAGPGLYPAVIVVHGGGWERGDRRMERPFAKQLAARGLVAVPVSYRLGVAGRFPNALFDLESAVRWLRAQAARYQIDPTRIGAVGGSAGGQLVALLGVSEGTPGLVGGVGQGNAGVQAVVDIDGLVDFSGAALVEKEARKPGAPTRFLGGSFAERAATWRLASPLTHVRGDSAPTLFINSAASTAASGGPATRGGAPGVDLAPGGDLPPGVDLMAPSGPILPGRAEMRDRLRTAGVTSDLVVIPGTPHPFWLVNPWFDVVVSRTAAFFNQQLRGNNR